MTSDPHFSIMPSTQRILRRIRRRHTFVMAIWWTWFAILAVAFALFFYRIH